MEKNKTNRGHIDNAKASIRPGSPPRVCWSRLLSLSHLLVALVPHSSSPPKISLPPLALSYQLSLWFPCENTWNFFWSLDEMFT